MLDASGNPVPLARRDPEARDRTLVTYSNADVIMRSRMQAYRASGAGGSLDYIRWVQRAVPASDWGNISNISELVAAFRAASDLAESYRLAGTIPDYRPTVSQNIIEAGEARAKHVPA